MKLTKGKISKIQNKKKQSLKRYKKGGKTRKSKTFRKRKHVNLHNASLKKYKGGSGNITEAKPATSEMGPIQTEPSLATSPEIAAQPLTEEPKPFSEEPKPFSEEVQPLAEEAQPLSEDAQQLTEEPQQLTEEDQQLKAAPLEDVTTQDDPGEGPGSNQDLPPPVSEEGSAQLSDSEIATNNLDNATSGSIEHSLQPPKLESEPIEVTATSVDSTPVESNPSIVTESLDNLLDYISTKIAKKLQQTSSFGSNNNADLNKDSFNSVANANETLAEA